MQIFHNDSCGLLDNIYLKSFLNYFYFPKISDTQKKTKKLGYVFVAWNTFAKNELASHGYSWPINLFGAHPVLVFKVFNKKK